MALRIRCPECRKRISVDEAFAGGMCRCPYCRELVEVPSAPGRALRGRRPTGRAGRPSAPGGAAPPPKRPATPEEAAQAAAEEEEVPVADPVRIQGLVALVLLGLVVVMLGVGTFLLVRYGSQLIAADDEETEAQNAVAAATRPAPSPVPRPRPPLPAPTTGPALVLPPGPEPPPVEPPVEGPAVDGLAIKPPVVYCLTAGRGRRLDFAVGKMLESIETLPEGAKFSIVLGEEGDLKIMPGGYVLAGPAGREKADAFREGAIRTTADRLAEAVAQAAGMEPRPATLVVFVARAISGEEIDNAITAADEAGAAIVTILLTEERQVHDTMKRLSEGLENPGRWKWHYRDEYSF